MDKVENMKDVTLKDIGNERRIVKRRCKQAAITKWCKLAIGGLVMIFLMKAWLQFYPLRIISTDIISGRWKSNVTLSIGKATTSGHKDAISSTTPPPPPTTIGAHNQPSVKIKTNGYYVNLTMDISQFKYNLMSIIAMTVVEATTVIRLDHNCGSISSKPQITNHIDFSHTLTHHQVVYAGSYTSRRHGSRYYYIVLDNPLPPGHYYIGFNLTSKLTSKLIERYTHPRASLDRFVDSMINLMYTYSCVYAWIEMISVTRRVSAVIEHLFTRER